MNSFVVRIYRQDDKDPGKIAGHVELVEHDKTLSFRSADELMEILTDPKARRRKKSGTNVMAAKEQK